MSFRDDTEEVQNLLTKEQILRDLLDLTTSLESKTDVSNPRALAGLYMLSKFLEKEMPELPENSDQITVSDIIFGFIEIHLKYMTSKDGTRAKQICEAIASLNLQRKETVSAIQKMTNAIP